MKLVLTEVKRGCFDEEIESFSAACHRENRGSAPVIISIPVFQAIPGNGYFLLAIFVVKNRNPGKIQVAIQAVFEISLLFRLCIGYRRSFIQFLRRYVRSFSETVAGITRRLIASIFYDLRRKFDEKIIIRRFFYLFFISFEMCKVQAYDLHGNASDAQKNWTINLFAYKRVNFSLETDQTVLI